MGATAGPSGLPTANAWSTAEHRRGQPLRDQRGRQRQARAPRDQRLHADSVVMGVRRQRDRVPAADRRAVPTGSGCFPWRATRKPRLFLESRFNLSHPEFSPDGRWMAYVSNESGTPEVYVQPYPGPGEKTRISTAGGFEPIWTANGRELLYRSGTPREPAVFLRGDPLPVSVPGRRAAPAVRGQGR